ncbi:hypothetical protein LTR70_004076 [Exophiala xenobiotica]|uniref:N-acetyltransferase domain-containing protein n=1 Tax=Lithohypha guttulata TaxID=1690604 RepID=A0ABR0KEW8_9EURO|nr:hypothetical protein LTR24_003480 [Lithohypha guttulata]KAK5321686.1 hypothetical protein LTR70_004076 [Exophiala xenobiotica]
MSVTVVPITPADIPATVQCIQDAFDSDPYNNWVFDKATPLAKGSFDTARNYASLKAKCEWGMRSSYALFYVAKDESGKVIGVSMWTTPAMTSQPQTWGDWLNYYRLWVEQGINVLWYQGWGGLRRDRYWIWKREQAACQSELWTDDNGYYFVNIVVVSPKAQGKGVGRMLFEVVMSKADNEGRRCYLESSRLEPNVRIYEKMGFVVSKKMRCVAEDGTNEGVDLFSMMREPQGGRK